jgi:carnitine 3-dehydrogenase
MKPTDIKKVVCAGAGVIGSGFATNFAMKGIPVVIFNVRAPRLEEAKKQINKNLEFLVSKGVLKKKEIENIVKHVSYTTNLEEAVKDAQFIQEQFPEKYEIKKEMLAEIEKYAPADTIIASSTSGLLITEMAKGMKHPERLVCGHPFNPPHLIPLVEVVKGEKTSDEVLKCTYDFYKLLGKEPVILNKEVLGFIANRLQLAMYREAEQLVLDGVCSVEDIDKSVTFGPGLRWAIMGPNLIFHLGGGAMGGIKGLLTALHDSAAMRLKDMANWTEEPIEWPEVAEKGVLEEIEHRTPETGNTIPEIAQFRDDMLIALLKLHKKL